MPAGRPTTYTPEIAQEICIELSKGRLLPEICKSDPKYPSETTVYAWIIKHEEFAKEYARARECQVEALVAQSIELSRDNSKDVIYEEILDEAGNVVRRIPKSDNTAVQRHKLEIDTIKWYSSKVYKRVFGDKQEHEITGKDGKDLIPVVNLTIKQK